MFLSSLPCCWPRRVSTPLSPKSREKLLRLRRRKQFLLRPTPTPHNSEINGRDQPRADDHEVDRDWRMRRGDGDRMGREDREMGPDWRMHRDREADRDRDKDRGRYGDRGDRDWDRADRDRNSRRYYDEDRPRCRVKVCIEYENGDEYCRYKEGR